MTRYFHQVFSMLCAMGHAHLDHNDLVTNVSPIPSSINVVRFSSRAPITYFIYIYIYIGFCFVCAHLNPLEFVNYLKW
jgi:hypothetical protein